MGPAANLWLVHQQPAFFPQEAAVEDHREVVLHHPDTVEALHSLSVTQVVRTLVQYRFVGEWV
jgi:hypothetical protein